MGHREAETRSAARVAGEACAVLVGLACVWWAWRADAHWFERHLTEARCMRTSGELHRVVVWRALAAIAGILCIGVARAPLGRWAARASLAGVARIALPIVLALGASELVLKYKADHRGGGMVATMRESAAYGSEMAPSTVSVEKIGDHEVRYVTNADGARVATPGDETKYDVPSILFTGESIVFGQGVDVEASFPFLVGKEMGVQTVNLAAIGYGGVLAYLRAKDALPHFDKPIALVSIFIPEMLERNVSRYRRVRVHGDTLELIEPEPLWTHFLHTRWIFRKAFPFNADDDEAIAVERAVLHETAKMARARGAIPLFVFTHYAQPCLNVDGELPWLARTLFDDPSLPVVTVEWDPSWVVPGDNHPDARAHAKIADAVVKALRGGHLADLGTPR